jgi:hypothetical protein
VCDDARTLLTLNHPSCPRDFRAPPRRPLTEWPASARQPTLSGVALSPIALDLRDGVDHDIELRGNDLRQWVYLPDSELPLVIGPVRRGSRGAM